MTSPDANTLLRWHTKLQMGTFLSHDDALGAGVSFVWSDMIADAFWNYAVGVQTDVRQLPAVVDLVRAKARNIDRKPSIYVTPESSPPNLDRILAVESAIEDCWMVRDLPESPVSRASELDVSVVESHNQLTQFLDIFRAAYGASVEPSEAVGYSGLPEEYPRAIELAHPPPDVTAINLLGSIDGLPVAVASIHCLEHYAGLYSVGVIPAYRNRGLGREISVAALRIAERRGSRLTFLQTEPDSPVERLYAGLGFRRSFIGSILTLK